MGLWCRNGTALVSESRQIRREGNLLYAVGLGNDQLSLLFQFVAPAYTLMLTACDYIVVDMIV